MVCGIRVWGRVGGCGKEDGSGELKECIRRGGRVERGVVM